MLSLLVAFCFFEPADVVVTGLSGEKLDGRLVSLSDVEVVVAGGQGESRLALDQVLEIRNASAPSVELPVGQVYLTDGTVLSFATSRTSGAQLHLTSEIYGDVQIPLVRVRAIRFRETADARDAWDGLLARSRTKDLLVLPRKNSGSQLDPTSGVVGTIDAESLRFVLGGDEIPVKLSRVFGVVYARDAVQARSAYVFEVGDRDRILADAAGYDAAADAFRIQLPSGTPIKIPAGVLRRIDCSGGKVRFLDEMKPVFHKFASVLPDPLYEEVFHYRVNQTMDGEPLRLGGRTWDRGLWLHSRTELRYDLGGDFSRFEAVVGIDDKIPRKDRTKARLTIRADERVVFDRDIWVTDPPRTLTCDISGARMLEILVDFGEKRADGTPPLHAALQDWVDLADARVVK